MFILEKIAKIAKINPGLYRDDFLAVTNSPPRATEAMRKKIQEIFSQYGLKTTAEAVNCKIVHFLDLTLNLEDESFRIYSKPGNLPQYVHKMSNHPPSINRNIHKNINQRLSSISSDERMFNTAAPIYQEAIKKI